MKLSGFSFVRNAFLLSYPLEASIHSLLDICNEVVIAVGNSEDETEEYLESISNPKLKIIDTIWDSNLTHDGLIYSQQTNIALQNCSGDWCIYLQADEVLHENDYTTIINDINKANEDSKIDGLLFKYLHFYGSYDYVGTGRQWYRNEIRAFRNTRNIISWGDAQGFRKFVDSKTRKLNVIRTEAKVYHYGWVRPPKAQARKIIKTGEYYHSKKIEKQNYEEIQDFDYNTAYELVKFKGSHPKTMQKIIEADREWTKRFNPDNLKQKPLLMKILDNIEKNTGIRIGEYKDFKIIR